MEMMRTDAFGVSKASPFTNLKVIADNPKGVLRYLTHSPQDKVINPIRYRLHPVQRAKKHESAFYRTSPRPSGYKGKHVR
jgi:hypothetical protein